jgi:hypothetical protein
MMPFGFRRTLIGERALARLRQLWSSIEMVNRVLFGAAPPTWRNNRYEPHLALIALRDPHRQAHRRSGR